MTNIEFAVSILKNAKDGTIRKHELGPPLPDDEKFIKSSDFSSVRCTRITKTQKEILSKIIENQNTNTRLNEFNDRDVDRLIDLGYINTATFYFISPWKLKKIKQYLEVANYDGDGTT